MLAESNGNLLEMQGLDHAEMEERLSPNVLSSFKTPRNQSRVVVSLRAQFNCERSLPLVLRTGNGPAVTPSNRIATRKSTNPTAMRSTRPKSATP